MYLLNFELSPAIDNLIQSLITTAGLLCDTAARAERRRDRFEESDYGCNLWEVGHELCQRLGP